MRTSFQGQLAVFPKNFAYNGSVTEQVILNSRRLSGKKSSNSKAGPSGRPVIIATGQATGILRLSIRKTFSEM